MKPLPHHDVPAADLRGWLRAQTRGAHDAAEATWAGWHADGDAAQYLAFLARMAAVHAGLGHAAAQSSDHAAFAHAETARLEALGADLGHPVGPPNVRPALHPDEAWGVIYCLSGSALGAASLLRTGAVRPGWPAAYLRAMARAAQHGEIRATFATLSLLRADRDRVLAGALQAFDAVAAPISS